MTDTTMRHFSTALILAMLIGIGLISQTAFASSIQLTSASQLSSGDTLGTLPAVQAVEDCPYVVSTPGNVLTFALTTPLGEPFGNYVVLDPDNVPGIGEGDNFSPVSISFATPVTQFGVQGHTAYIAPYVFTFDVYDQSTLLGQYTAAGTNTELNLTGSFLGAEATGGSVITSVVVSSTDTGDPDNFSTGLVTYRDYAPTPESSTLIMFAVGAMLIALQFLARRQRRASV